MSKQDYRKPQVPKTEAKFLNDSGTLVEISNIRNSGKAFFELSKQGSAKDNFKDVVKSGKMTMEVPQGTNLKKLVAIAVKCGMDEVREKYNYSALKKAVLDGEENTKALEDNYALSYMLNEGVFNMADVEESFVKKYEAFTKGNADKPQEFEGYKKVVEKCFGAIENLSETLKEKGVLKTSEKGNLYLDANDYQKAEMVALINNSAVADIDNAMKVGMDNYNAYKKAVADGLDLNSTKKEEIKETQTAEATTDSVEAEKPKRASKKSKQ